MNQNTKNQDIILRVVMPLIHAVMALPSFLWFLYFIFDGLDGTWSPTFSDPDLTTYIVLGILLSSSFILTWYGCARAWMTRETKGMKIRRAGVFMTGLCYLFFTVARLLSLGVFPVLWIFTLVLFLLSVTGWVTERLYQHD